MHKKSKGECILKSDCKLLIWGETIMALIGFNCHLPTWSCQKEDRTIIELSKKYNKTPAQITLNYLKNKNIVVIPRT